MVWHRSAVLPNCEVKDSPDLDHCPSEFQAMCMDLLHGKPDSVSIHWLAEKTQTGNLAIYSALKSLEKAGWVFSTRSDDTRWGVLCYKSQHPGWGAP